MVTNSLRLPVVRCLSCIRCPSATTGDFVQKGDLAVLSRQ